MHTLALAETGLGHQFEHASSQFISYTSENSAAHYLLPVSGRYPMVSDSLEFFTSELVSSTPKSERRSQAPKPALRINANVSEEGFPSIAIQPEISPVLEAQKPSPTPSYQERLARREKARRRHGINFESEAHVHVSDALRAVIDCHRKAIAEDLAPGIQPEEDDDAEGEYYWEADTVGDTGASVADRSHPPSRPSSVAELAAAFPYPPMHTPESTRSPILSAYMEMASLASTDSPAPLPNYTSRTSCRFRRQPPDPSDSFARLEISMSQLRAFNPLRSSLDVALEDDSSDSTSLLESDDCISPVSTEASSETSSPHRPAKNPAARADLWIPVRPEAHRLSISSPSANIESAESICTDSTYSCLSPTASSRGDYRRASSRSVSMQGRDVHEKAAPALPTVPPVIRSSSQALQSSAIRMSSRPAPTFSKDAMSLTPSKSSTPFLFRPVRQTYSTNSANSSYRNSISLALSASAPVVTTPSRPLLPTSLNLKPATPPPSEMQASHSFINMTPEQPSSRMSKIWNKACSGVGLKKQKSLRWTKASFA